MSKLLIIFQNLAQFYLPIIVWNFFIIYLAWLCTFCKYIKTSWHVKNVIWMHNNPILLKLATVLLYLNVSDLFCLKKWYESYPLITHGVTKLGMKHVKYDQKLNIWHEFLIAWNKFLTLYLTNSSFNSETISICSMYLIILIVQHVFKFYPL